MHPVRLAALAALSALPFLVSGQRSITNSPLGSVYTGGAQGFVSDSTTTNPFEAQLPIANAGPNQTVGVGSNVTLDGSGSTNPSGTGTLTFSWQLVSSPSGSQSTLLNPKTLNPGFVADVPGTYVVNLTVSNGAGSSSTTVIISTSNVAPVAGAGPNQTLPVGSMAVLDGGGSFDVNGDLLTYQWSLVALPQGSAATLTGTNSVMPSLFLDKPGNYVARLIVNDGKVNSAPSIVSISTYNSPPVAHAGLSQLVSPGATVQLDGSGSTDVDGDLLTYRWNLIAVPPGSAAVLNSPSSVNPTFTVDVAGTYLAQLIVNDGNANSIPSTVLITTSNTILAPIANAGPNQTVQQGSSVQLAGNITDAQGLRPSVQWSLISKPVGSSAVLSGGTIANPTFVADMPGIYVAQLIASNGVLTSVPSTVVVATSGVPPLAKPGTNESVEAGATVTLDGSSSSDSNNDPLSYSWSLLNRPAGSAAAVSDGNSMSPIFIADMPGIYVAQLIVNDGFENSNPATVEITATAASTITVALDSASIGMDRTISGSISLSSPAPAGGILITLSTATSGIVLLNPSSITISAGSTTGTFTVTGVGWGSTTITANAMGYSPGTASATVVNLGSITLPANLNVGLSQSVPVAVTLPGPAPAGGVIVTLGSGDTSKAVISPTSITIPAGQSSPSIQPLVTGVGLGATTISVSAAGYTSGNQSQVLVTASISFSPQALTILGNATQNLTLSLSAPAPAGGVTINLSSDNTNVATVPATVTFFAGAVSAIVPVTGVTSGSATIQASALPTIANTTATVTVSNAGGITLLSGGAVPVGQSAPLSVILSSPTSAPVYVTLSSSNPSVLTVTPQTVLIGGGSQVPVLTPQVTGVSVGTAAIIASAPNYPLSSIPMTVFIGAAFVPASLTITGPTSANLTLQLSSPAPPGGLTINLSSDNTSVATVPATVTFAANATTVTVPVTGAAAGTTTIHASALPTIPDTTAAITVLNADGTPAGPSSGGSGGTSSGASGGITLNNISVGQNLEAIIVITLPPAAAASGLTLTLTSSDPTKLTLATAGGEAGSGSLTVNVPANFGLFGVWAQALASSGSVTVTASAEGYTSATSTVTLTPSAFVLVGPQSGVSSITTNEGLNTSLTVESVELDSSFNVLGEQPVAGGVSVNVNVTSSNPSVGTIASSPVTFQGGDETASTQFNAAGSGVTTLTASVPTGFSTPAQGANSLTVTVSSEKLTAPGNITVGKNLETVYDSNGNPLVFGLNGVTSSAGEMTITSNNPSLLLLSASPDGAVAGSASITLNVAKGVSYSPAFYVQALGSSGTATYTASMSGFGTATGTVTLAPSGFAISAANHSLGQQNGVVDFAALIGLTGFGITISPVVLDSSGNVVPTQQEFVAGGMSATIDLQNSNSSVASIPASTTISGGFSSVAVEINPLSEGYTTLSLIQPAGYSTPAQDTQAQAEVCGSTCPSAGN